MEGCEEKTRRTLENGRVGQEGKGLRELFQMRVTVIGFGMMGRQIAQVFAQHGHEVSVTDENPAAVKSGLDEVARGTYGIESAVAKAKITRAEGTKALQQIRPAADMKEACNSADLVIEASKLLEEETAKIRDIDLAMKLGYNHPMGPFELADFVGLDTRLRNLEALFQATGDEKWIPPKALREMVNQGYLGDPSRRKGSKGGYREFFTTR